MNLESIFNVTNFVNTDLFYAFVAINQNYTSIAAEASLLFLRNILEFISDNWCSPILFTELQTTLLTVFLVIISVNLVLIAFYWHKYGGVITDRFIRPSTLKEIEELKLSVAKLKLPYEHTPRI